MPSLSHPLGVISASDQSGLILILTALSLTFILTSFAVRIYVRVPQGLWKWDDNILTVATVFSCVQTSLVFYEVHLGLGNRKVFNRDSGENDGLEKYYYANNFLYLVVLLFSKAAIGFLFLRLTLKRGHVIAIWSILGLCAGWFVLSILLISIGAPQSRVFHQSFGRWLAVGITDSITELIFVLMAAFLVSGLRMSKVRKGTVVFAFSLRLLAIPACGLRLYYLDPSTLPDNHSMAISLVVVCTQIQLGYGIMAASVTVLKPFMAVYEKPDDSYTGYSGNTRNKNPSGTNNSDFKLTSTVRSARGDRQQLPPHVQSGKGKAGRAAADPTQPYSAYEATAVAGNTNKRGGNDKSGHEKGDSIHSHDSRRMIIERKTDWSVRYEEAASQKSIASETGGSV